jgi:hypothetical protein
MAHERRRGGFLADFFGAAALSIARFFRSTVKTFIYFAAFAWGRDWLWVKVSLKLY